MSLVIFLAFLGEKVFAAEKSPGDVLDQAISNAILNGACVDYFDIAKPETEKYFRQVFSSEKTKEKWLERVFRKLQKSKQEIEVDVFISSAEFELRIQPEQFIKLYIKPFGSTYTFFESGKMSCVISNDVSFSENYSLKNLRQKPIP